SRHLFDRRAAVGLVGMHLMVRACRLAPLGMRLEHYPRLGVGDEAVAKRGWDGRLRRGAQPFRDEMCGERTDRAKLGEASTRFLNRGSLLRPHERRARRSPQRALFAPLA